MDWCERPVAARFPVGVASVSVLVVGRGGVVEGLAQRSLGLHDLRIDVNLAPLRHRRRVVRGVDPKASLTGEEPEDLWSSTGVDQTEGKAGGRVECLWR